MERRLISSGSPYEPVVGYSRAVVAGDRIFVAGCAPVMPDGADPPPDTYGQAKRCLEIIDRALAETWHTRETRGTSMRMAAYGLAVQRVAEATTTRGLYP